MIRILQKFLDVLKYKVEISGQTTPKSGINVGLNLP